MQRSTPRLSSCEVMIVFIEPLDAIGEPPLRLAAHINLMLQPVCLQWKCVLL